MWVKAATSIKYRIFLIYHENNVSVILMWNYLVLHMMNFESFSFLNN